jgi:hypothetical protein
MSWPLYRKPSFLGNYTRISATGTREWLLSRTAPANRTQRKNEKQLFYLGLKRECCILEKCISCGFLSDFYISFR